MYKTIITIKDTVPAETMAKIQEIVPKAFNNRAGIVKNTSKLPNVFEFEGGEESYGCLQLGIMLLDQVNNFKNYVGAWHWFDEEEPSDNCDVLSELAIPVR